MRGDDKVKRIRDRERNARVAESLPPPDNALPIVHSQLTTYFDPGKNVYWINDGRGEWYQIRKGDLMTRWRLEGLRATPQCANYLSQLENETLRTQHDFRVEWAGKLAGYASGIHRVCDQPILIIRGPDLPQPAAGKWDLLRAFLGELLGAEAERFWAWIRSARESLKAGPPWRPGQALILAGPAGCGKSLLQNIITEIFGGRSARPYRYMKDKTPFNADLLGAEHLIVEDESPARDMASRRAFGANIKNMVANETQSFHPKGKDALSLLPFWRISISLNDEPEDLLVLPPLEDSIRDKLLMLRCFRANESFPTGDMKSRRAFRDQLSKDIPGFLHFLRGWRVPAAMKCSRYGVKHWQDPVLVEALEHLSAEVQLFELIAASGILPEQGGAWAGTANELQAALNDKYKRGEVDRLLTWPAALGVYLSRLAKKKPDCVRAGGRNAANVGLWEIAHSGLSPGPG